jgi:hypothetical protein
MIRMDQALPVIPTFRMYWAYARPHPGETRFIPNIWITLIKGMIHLRPASHTVGLVGTSGRTHG